MPPASAPASPPRPASDTIAVASSTPRCRSLVKYSVRNAKAKPPRRSMMMPIHRTQNVRGSPRNTDGSMRARPRCSMTSMATDTFELLDEEGRPLPGFLVSAGAPAMIVVHEVFGLNEQIKNVARRLARDANVTTFAVDLFEGRTTLDMATGYKMAQLIRWKPAIELIRKAP